MNRNEKESYLAFVKRVTNAVNCGLIDYDEWSKSLLGQVRYSSETLRRCFQVVNSIVQGLENDIEESNDEKLREIKEAQEQLIKERKKLQTVNLQAQEYYRAVGRNELLVEQIKEAIAGLEPVKTKNIVYSMPSEKIGLLVVADAHYDSNFTVNGLFGEVANVYNKEIFQARMWALLAKIDADDFDIDKLKIVFGGDSLEGVLRMSSLTKLRQPVVKSAIEFAEFVSSWLVEVKNRLGVPVEVAFVPGNHTVSRYLSQKSEFPEENLEYIIHSFVKLRLENCNDIKIEPYDDVYFTNIFSENLIFAHGETKDLESLMQYFENLYDITIDACYGAHFHSESSKSVGVGVVGSKRIIRVPSMMGVDPFAKSIMKNNRAGAYFACFDEDGECFNKIYYLN